MSDGGSTARIEQAIADKLNTITNNGKKVFKTADIWKYQITVNNAGGVEGFGQYAPFAFAAFKPPTDFSREGDGDLNQKLRFGVFIGQTSKEPGIARIGDDNHIGISLMRDLVLAAFDNQHPGDGFDCNDFKYDGEAEEVDEPHNYGLSVFFITDRITI